MARQVEIALADSLRARPTPQSRIVQPRTATFWGFLGNIFSGASRRPIVVPARAPSRHTEVKGLIQAFVDRSGGIDAMWVLNADGAVLYSSRGHGKGESALDPQLRRGLRRGIPTINSKTQGSSSYYDVLVPLQMPEGVKGPGGLRLYQSRGLDRDAGRIVAPAHFALWAWRGCGSLERIMPRCS
jgi:hypothetical protein